MERMTKRSEAVKLFLNKNTQYDLAALYHSGMEVQVNVSGEGGTKTDNKWSDGTETWGPFRMPYKANTDPEDNDYPVKFDFDKRVQGIGLTGWDWKAKKSRWVAFDFDAVTGHSDLHTKKLSSDEMAKVQEVACKLPFVTVRKSTSGRGLHLYVFTPDVTTENHNEHAALARSILSMMSGLTGYNFSDKVDVCGQVMWVWHEKQRGTDGLSLIKQGVPLTRVPDNWRDHLDVIGRKSSRITSTVQGIDQRSRIRLDEGHVKLLDWLKDKPGWWDSDNHYLKTHTFLLQQAHRELEMKGQFHTLSQGRDLGTPNCWAFPLKNGAWSVYRYGTGTAEHAMWGSNGRGQVRSYLNRELTLEDACKLDGGVDLEQGGFQFNDATSGAKALGRVGIAVDLPDVMAHRVMKVRVNKYDKIVISVQHETGDKAMDRWTIEKGWHKKLYANPRSDVTDEVAVVGDFDDLVRHVVTETGEDQGWLVCTDDGGWRAEPVQHVRLFLQGRGLSPKDINIILGTAVNQAWMLVNKPFQPEYPGNREWNRSKARFRVVPTTDGEALSHPTWDKILAHCGQSLNGPVLDSKWCRENGILTGRDYLRLWLAALVQFPQHPLPYLAFYGPQDSGKSTFHEAFCQLVLDGGYMDGALSLTNQSLFNGELEGAILCTLEETDLRDKVVYQRVKDWVTSNQISIHHKGETPRKTQNFTHWVQCVNDRDFIPKFPGDTRIVVMHVPGLKDEDKIPKRTLWTQLAKEAPDFLGSLLTTSIPDSKDRLYVPVIKTADGQAAEFSAMTEVQQFFSEKVTKCQGAFVSLDDLFNEFQSWIGVEEGLTWTKIRFSKALPQEFPVGRFKESGHQLKCVGNVSMDPNAKPGTLLVMSGPTYMKREKT